jgi:hypothetical protein
LIQGSIEVLPVESMAGFCYGNVTSIQPKIVKYNKERANFNLEGSLLELKDIIKLMQGSFFNCFYTVFDPITAGQIR